MNRHTFVTTRRDQRGFTLLELMITALVGAIVIAGVYSMYTISTKTYRIQNESLDALGQLRSAHKQLRADLRSAGYNSPGHTGVEGWVTTAGGAVYTALAVDHDDDPQVANPASNTGTNPHRLRILGDFWSQQTYRTASVTGATVTLEWDVATHGDQAEFERIFDPYGRDSHRILRLETYGVARQEQFIPIATADFGTGANPTITLAQDPVGISGFGGGNEVSITGYVRYELGLDATGLKSDLFRVELLADGDTEIAESRLVIAEYIVDMQIYDVIVNRTIPEIGTMRQVPVDLYHMGTSVEWDAEYPLAPDDPANNFSHHVRSLTVKLSARTPHEDEGVPFAARIAQDAPLHAYELDPGLPGAARVFELASVTALTAIVARRQ